MSLECRCVTNSKWDKGGISKVHIVRGDQETEVSSPIPMKFGSSPKITTSMHVCFLLTGFIAICFPPWADLFQLSLISWSSKSQCCEFKECSSSVIHQDISMFLHPYYKSILWKHSEVSSYQKANVGLKHSGIYCMCNPSLLSLQYPYFCGLC